jgi:hypothetical protein
MTEPVLGPSGSGSVVLNVGPGVGALVLHTPAGLDGCEIEISPCGIPAARRTHSQVRERRAGGSVQYAAVYPELAAGDYTIWRDATTPAGTVTIDEASVTSYQWPADAAIGHAAGHAAH